MLQKIKHNVHLIPYLKEIIEDEGIQVEIAENITMDEIAIIKVDDFYNDLHLAAPPKAIDHLVVVDCECDWYVLYLLELKNVNSPKYLNIRDIQEKFDNTIKDFLSNRFGEIFLNDKFKYKGVKLYLVSDAYGIVGHYDNYEEYKKVQEKRQNIQGKDSLKVDFNLSKKLYRFRGKIVFIMYDIPPNPIIRKIS